MWAFIVSLPSDRRSSSLLVGAAKLAREAVGRPPVRRTVAVGSGGVAVERRTWREERRGWGKGGACCAVNAGGDDVDGRVKSDARMQPVVMLDCILQFYRLLLFHKSGPGIISAQRSTTWTG